MEFSLDFSSVYIIGALVLGIWKFVQEYQAQKKNEEQTPIPRRNFEKDGGWEEELEEIEERFEEPLVASFETLSNQEPFRSIKPEVRERTKQVRENKKVAVSKKTLKDQNQLAQAIMWSEILSPPKSKRKY